MATDETLALVRQAAEGVSAGATQVVAASAELRHDEDEPYVLLVLRLAPPSGGRDTWPLDDVYQIRQEVRENIGQATVSLPVRLSVASAEDDTGDIRPDSDVARSLASNGGEQSR